MVHVAEFKEIEELNEYLEHIEYDFKVRNGKRIRIINIIHVDRYNFITGSLDGYTYKVFFEEVE